MSHVQIQAATIMWEGPECKGRKITAVSGEFPSLAVYPLIESLEEHMFEMILHFTTFKWFNLCMKTAHRRIAHNRSLYQDGAACV